MLRHPTSPIGAGSKSYLEVKPIDSVTLSDGRAWKNARRPAAMDGRQLNVKRSAGHSDPDVMVLGTG